MWTLGNILDPNHSLRERTYPCHLNSVSKGFGATSASQKGMHEVVGGRVVTSGWAHSWTLWLLCVIHGDLSSVHGSQLLAELG